MPNIIEEYRRPSFGEQILPGILGGAQSFVQSLSRKKQETQRNDQLKKLIGEDVSGLTPDIQKLMLKYKLEGQNKEGDIARKLRSEQSEMQKKIQEEQMKRQQDEAIINDLEERLGLQKGSLSAYIGKPELAMKATQPKKTSDNGKNNDKVQLSSENHERTQNAFNEMSELLKGGNLGKFSSISSYFGGKTSHDVAKFKTLTGALESQLKDMVSKGVLSKDRFKYIIDTLLPSPTDFEEEIKGKLEALEDILGLDDTNLYGKSTSKDVENSRDEKGRISISSFQR